ncbi:MAG TPA: hypothetical protein VNA17_09335 [Pyrinomonadaceae bacterium]|nr:hypothetical protein [Pyrinomonadaceae bacterium]
MRYLQIYFALTALALGIGNVSGQSLKPDDPYPLKAGINQGTSDSLVGTHYWYFYGMPGSTRVTVRFVKATALFGAPIANTSLTVTLSDEKRTWRNTKVITPARNQSEATFTAEKIDKKLKVIIAIAPPNQNLLRAGGDYEIEATGAVQFDEVRSAADPIVRTYSPKTGLDDYGAAKFLADGTIETANGFRGTWKLFDRENRIYSVVIEKFRVSVQYLPGYGLVRPDDPSLIVFQELRR